MSYFESVDLAGTKRRRVHTNMFDPTPAKRASPPKKAAKEKRTHRGVPPPLRVPPSVSHEERSFLRWMDAETVGRYVPGLKIGLQDSYTEIEDWLCDVLMNEL